jgi:glycosyltransferase involved in cell wall biosynthesis
MVKIDIVIPSYIGDFNCIMVCIKNLSEQTVKPNNIIICVSEINNTHKIYLENEINKLELDLNVIINDITIKQNASANRNRGIDYCLQYTKPDYIMFCDCDDIIHTKKIEIFLYILQHITNDINLLVHNFAFKHDTFDIYSSYIANKDKLMLCYNNKTCTNLYTIPETHIAHGYAVVKTELCKDIKYNEQLTNGEDGTFCQEINNKYGKVYSYNEKLIKYIP